MTMRTPSQPAAAAAAAAVVALALVSIVVVVWYFGRDSVEPMMDSGDDVVMIDANGEEPNAGADHDAASMSRSWVPDIAPTVASSIAPQSDGDHTGSPAINDHRSLGIQLTISETNDETGRTYVRLELTNGTREVLYFDPRGFWPPYWYMTMRGEQLSQIPASLPPPYLASDEIIRLDPGEVWTTRLRSSGPNMEFVSTPTFLMRVSYRWWGVGLPDGWEDKLFKGPMSSNIIEITVPRR